MRKEVKHIIKHSVPETQLVHFHFTHHELHQLKWVKSHEFILNGHYYDVIHKKQDSNGCFFQCIRDDQETQLFAQLSSMTSFNLSHSGEQHPVNVWFKFISEPMEVVTADVSAKVHPKSPKENVLIQWQEIPYLVHFFIETPPPDLVS